MARIIGGIGISHTPSMGVEYDRGMARGFDPRWQIWYDGTRPVRDWIAQIKPDLMVVVYNDHLNHFTFDAYPNLAIGIAPEFEQADEGFGLRPLPNLPSDTEFAMHMTNSLVNDDFDLTVCQEMKIDHGIYSWMPYLFDQPWSVPLVPICTNMVRLPLPTSRRMVKLGQSIQAAVAAYPKDARVLVVATGGMSHQIHGARFGMANVEWDHYFLQRIETHLETLAALPHEEIMSIGGDAAVELTLWFAMRSALNKKIKRVYDFYTFPQITGCGVVAFDNPQ